MGHRNAISLYHKVLDKALVCNLTKKILFVRNGNKLASHSGLMTAFAVTPTAAL